MGVLGGLFLALALAVRFNKKIEETLSLSLMIMIFVIYAFGLAGILKVGVYVDFGLLLLSVVYLAFVLIKDGARVKTSLFSWGFLALCFYIVFFAYYSHNRCFSHPDEFYCWGLMTKGYYYYQDLFTSYATAISGNHPPFIPLINYYSCMTWKEYSDSIAFFGNSILKISLVLPVFAHIKSRMTVPKFLGIVALLPLLHVVSDLEGFDHILADGLIALLLCFFIMTVLNHLESHDMFYYVSAMLSLMAICLSKRLGFIFASLAIVCVVVIYSKKISKWYYYLGGYALGMSVACYSWFKLRQHIAFVPIIIFVCACILLFVFNKTMMLEDHKKTVALLCEAFAVVGGVFVFCVGFLGRTGAYSYAVMARLGEDLFTVKNSDGHIVLSYGLFMVIALLFTAYLKQYKKGEFQEIKYISFFTAVSMGLYLIVMLTVHIKSIGPYRDYIEGLIQRYLIPWEIVVVFLIFLSVVVYNAKASYLHVLVAFLMLLVISSSSDFYRGIFFKHYVGDYSAFKKANIEIQPGDMIYFIDEKPSYGYSDREFFYTMFPARTNYIYDMMNDNNGVIEGTAQELSEEIAEQYNYVYIQSVTDDFAERYKSLFENASDIKTNSVYSVIKEGESIKLRLES